MSDTPFWESRAIYVVRSGSHAYGTNIPGSDEDTRGVCIPPADYLIGLRDWQHDRDAEHDRTIYSLRRYVSLGLASHPQTLEMLHVRESDVLLMTPLGRILREGEHIFLSKLLGHKARDIATQHMKTLQDKHSARHGKHAELIDRYGYDTKDASHVIRVMRMAVEALTVGTVHTYRHDRDELRAIRIGEWPLDAVLGEAGRLHAKLNDAAAMSTLPDEPDFEAANAMVMDLTRRALEGYL